MDDKLTALADGEPKSAKIDVFQEPARRYIQNMVAGVGLAFLTERDGRVEWVRLCATSRVSNACYLTMVFDVKNALLALVACLCLVNFCRADELELYDTLVLKSGIQLTGKIIDKKTENNREYIFFRTSSGNVFKLDTKRLVKRVHEINVEYKERLGQLNDESADEHWAMYAWCKEKDKSGFKREMEYHLRRIVNLDNNDEKAIKLLKYDRFNGKVLNRNHQLSGHGYVRVTGGWVPKQFLDVQQFEKQNESFANEQKIAFAKWVRQIGKTDNQSLSDDLNGIVRQYPDTVGLIYARALKENRDEIRMIYVNALAQAKTLAAQNALVHFAIRDSNRVIREQAVSHLHQPQFDPSSAALTASQFLRDSNRVYLLRAANLIGELGQMSPFGALVGALRTTHVMSAGEDPRRMNSAFGSGGAGANSFDFGSKKPVKRTFDNQEVATALHRITGEQFGFDAEAWKAWYVSEHTIDRYDIYGDQ